MKGKKIQNTYTHTQPYTQDCSPASPSRASVLKPMLTVAYALSLNDNTETEGTSKHTSYLIQAEILNFKFPNLHSFLTWKQQKEQEANSQYVQPCSHQTSASTKRWYYYCNRSGKYVSRGDGTRQLKSQGTQKIGHCCTAHIKVTQDFSGELHVEFCNYHVHPIKLGHLQLSDSTRLMIASKLKEGVTIEKILDDVRNQTDVTSLNRQHLITRQDIRNIKHQFNRWH